MITRRVRRSVAAFTALLTIPCVLVDSLFHHHALATTAAMARKISAASYRDGTSSSVLLLHTPVFPRHSRTSSSSISSCWNRRSSNSCSRRSCVSPLLLSSRASRLDDAIASATTRMMSISTDSLDLYVFPDDSYSRTGDKSSSSSSLRLTIKAFYLEPSTGMRRTWTAKRSEEEFFALGVTLMKQLGGSDADSWVPGPPGDGSSADSFQSYLRKLVVLPEVTSFPALYEFLDVPPEIVQEPVLLGEVVDDASWDGRGRSRFRSANPDDPRTSSSYPYPGDGPDGGAANKSGATVAGAVVGGLVAGPLGAAIGAIAARTASGREDSVGDVAKGAGAVADAAMGKAQSLERELELSRKAKTAAGRAKKAIQRVDSEYSVRQRAKQAAERTVRVARKTNRDLRVTERATGAVKATEQAAKRAAEAAKRADKEHRIRERAANALRRVRSEVKKSVENLEDRRKQNDR